MGIIETISAGARENSDANVLRHDTLTENERVSLGDSFVIHDLPDVIRGELTPEEYAGLGVGFMTIIEHYRSVNNGAFWERGVGLSASVVQGLVFIRSREAVGVSEGVTYPGALYGMTVISERMKRRELLGVVTKRGEVVVTFADSRYKGDVDRSISPNDKQNGIENNFNSGKDIRK